MIPDIFRLREYALLVHHQNGENPRVEEIMASRQTAGGAAVGVTRETSVKSL
jgi:hypothetical protein